MDTELSRECEKRRQKLKELAPNSAFILFSGREGHLQRFRAQSLFYYLTGFNDPDTIAVIRPNEEDSYTLFVRPRDPLAETWDGRRLGVEGTRKTLGCDQAFSNLQLSEKLPELLAPVEQVHYFLGESDSADRVVLEAIDQAKRLDRRSGRSRADIVDPTHSIGEMRLTKSAFEINKMRAAAEATVEGHRRAMAHCRPGLNEIQIYGHILSGFYELKAQGEGYCSIIAGGDNATVLHYRTNNCDLNEGELLLIDAGAEKDFYTADITRTFPINGKFSPAQKDVYQAVLETQTQLIQMVEPGKMSIPELHDESVKLLTQKMIDLKLLNGSVDENIETKAYQKYYPHGISHYLGMDVHDLGRAKVDGKARKFSSGMVITVEPGLYIPADDDSAPQEMRGIGVRIEDDVLVTEKGQDVLTKDLIKEAAELENFIGSALDH